MTYDTFKIFECSLVQTGREDNFTVSCLGCTSGRLGSSSYLLQWIWVWGFFFNTKHFQQQQWLWNSACST